MTVEFYLKYFVIPTLWRNLSLAVGYWLFAVSYWKFRLDKDFHSHFATFESTNKFYSFPFNQEFPIFKIVLPATSLITIAAIMYQADMAQAINTIAAAVVTSGKPK